MSTSNEHSMIREFSYGGIWRIMPAKMSHVTPDQSCMISMMVRTYCRASAMMRSPDRLSPLGQLPAEFRPMPIDTMGRDESVGRLHVHTCRAHAWHKYIHFNAEQMHVFPIPEYMQVERAGS